MHEQTRGDRGLLEPYAGKLARTVLRGRGGGDAALLPDTGHASRLNREFKGRYGSHAYAREELVAELASAFVCASLSITPTVRHADYLGAWLEVLKQDNRAIFNAASLASKAADFILAFGETPAPQRAQTQSQSQAA